MELEAHRYTTVHLGNVQTIQAKTIDRFNVSPGKLSRPINAGCIGGDDFACKPLDLTYCLLLFRGPSPGGIDLIKTFMQLFR